MCLFHFIFFKASPFSTDKKKKKKKKKNSTDKKKKKKKKNEKCGGSLTQRGPATEPRAQRGAHIQ